MGKRSPFGVNWTPGVELFVDGAWLDVSDDLSRDGVQIERGRDSERSRVEPSSMAARLKNATGRYSPRNPSSDLYGLIGRNTKVRTYVDLGAPWLHLEGTNANATCPDSAALSITGDLDVRWWGRRNEWGNRTDLIGKYGAGSQRSWILQCDQDTGTVTLYWSTDGSALLSATSVPLPAWARTIAIRATLDVNNGAGGRTVTFYTSTDLTAGWTQHGDPIVQSGTTSIFDSTATVLVGKNPNTTASSSTVRVYGWEVRQGIGGTVRTSVDTSTLTAGATSFSDGTNTWTVNSPAAVNNRHYRFHGDVTEWPQRWEKTGSRSSSTPIVGAGLLRRMIQGAKPLKSPLRRALPNVVNLCAYWPMEDQAGSTSFWGAGGGAKQATRTAAVTTGNYDGFPGGTVAPTLGEGRITCNVPNYSVTTELAVRFMAMVENGTPNNSTLMSFYMRSGVIRRVDLVYETGSGGLLVAKPYDDDGVLVGLSTPVMDTAVDNIPAYCSVELEQSGSDVLLKTARYVPSEPTVTVGSGTITGANFGVVTQVRFNPGLVDFGGSAVGHVTVQRDIVALTTSLATYVSGHAGEEADARVERLATENGITMRTQGPAATCALMGAQRSDRGLVTLLQECADSDQGILYEPRENDDLGFRRLAGMLAQPAAFTIAYTDNLLLPFEPTDDDQTVRNDVEVIRDGGSSATYTLTSGALSTQAPPNGVGTYDESVTLSLYDDGQCEDQASWLVHLGTHDEARWPVIGLDLAHPTFLADPVLTRKILALELGDRFDVTDLPDWLPPDAVQVIAQKTFESIEPLGYRIEFTCTPYRPYSAPVWSTSGVYANDTTVTSGSTVTTTATSFTVTAGADGDWSSADGPVQMVMGGERITVGSISGSGTQTFSSVTRSVNGVVKSHPVGTKVSLAEPNYWGL